MGCLPRKSIAVDGQVNGFAELFALHDDGDHGCLAVARNIDRVNLEGEFNAVAVELVVHERAVVDMAAAVVTLLGVDDEEVLQWFCAVEGGREVGQVVTELHGLVVNAVGPLSEHGVCRDTVGCVAHIFEVFKGNDCFGFGGAGVGGDTGGQAHVVTVVEVHLDFERAQRAVVLADIHDFGLPGLLTFVDDAADGVGTVNPAAV